MQCMHIYDILYTPAPPPPVLFPEKTLLPGQIRVNVFKEKKSLQLWSEEISLVEE